MSETKRKPPTDREQGKRFASLNEFDSFVREFEKESDRAAVILGAAKLDIMLYQVLDHVLKPAASKTDELLEGDAPLATFSARTMMCYRLGLIDEHLFRAINLVRRIRNSFAHDQASVSLESGVHRDRIRELVTAFNPFADFHEMVSMFFGEKRRGPALEFRAVVAVIALRLEAIVETAKPIYSSEPMTLIPPMWRKQDPE